MLITHTLIVRDHDDQIIDTIEIENADEIAITRAHVREIIRTHKQAHKIDLVQSIERRPQ